MTAPTRLPADDHTGSAATRGTLMVLLAEGLALPAGLVATILLAAHLPTSEFGALTLSLAGIAWLEWSLVVLLSRTAYKLVAEFPRSSGVQRAIVRAYATLGALVGLIVFAAADAIARALAIDTYGNLVRVLALEIPLFVLAQSYRSLLVGRALHRGRALAAGTRWTVRAMLVAAGVAFGASVEFIAALVVCATAAELGMAWMQLSSPTRDVEEKPLQWTRLLSTAIPVALSAIALRLLDRMDIFALRMLGGSLDAVGAYGVAQNLAIGPAVFTSALVPTVIAAVSSRWHSGDVVGARMVVNGAMRAVLLLIPLVLLGAAAAPMLVATMFRDEYVLAGTLFRLLATGAAASAVVSVASGVLVATGHARTTVLIAIPMFVVAIAGFVVVAPTRGAIGIAAVMSLTWIAGAIVTTVAMHRATRAPFPFATLARSVMLGAAIAWAVSMIAVEGIALFGMLFVAVLMIAAGVTLSGEMPISLWKSFTLRRQTAA